MIPSIPIKYFSLNKLLYLPVHSYVQYGRLKLFVEYNNVLYKVSDLFVSNNFTCCKCHRQASIFEVSEKNRLIAYIFDNGRLISLTKDHIIPRYFLSPHCRRKLGKLNNQCMCEDCNNEKGHQILIDFGKRFKKLKRIQKICFFDKNLYFIKKILNSYKTFN